MAFVKPTKTTGQAYGLYRPAPPKGLGVMDSLMSIQDAIMTATKDILSSYLAPELVEQLSDDIMHRAAPEIEAALTEFAGFDFGKTSSRGKSSGVTAMRTKASAKTARKRKEANDHMETPESHDDNSDSMRASDDSEHHEPAPQDMT